MRRIDWNPALLLVSVGVAACASATPTDTPPPTLNPILLTSDPIEMQTPFATLSPPPPVSECFRSAMVAVYADLDGDGTRDADEPPLEGVNVGIIDNADPPSLIYSADTSADGTAEVGFITTREDCGDNYLIGLLSWSGEYTPPPGVLRPFGDVWNSGQTLSLGLLPEEPARTPTPLITPQSS